MARNLKIVLVLLLLGAAIIAIGFLERWREDAQQQSELLAKATDLEQLFRQFAVVPAILSKDPRLIDALVSPNQSNADKANRALLVATERSDAAFAFLMDTTGLTIASSNYAQSVSFVGNNYGFRPYFTKALAGKSATFFAVGATTGIAGYFVSEPILHNSRVLGVVVVKLEPQKLPEAWNAGDSIVLVRDDLGVAILSTEDRMLYNRTTPLNEKSLNLIETERRYVVASNSYLNSSKPKTWRFISENAGLSSIYKASTLQLDVEPWSLSVLTPMRVIYERVLRDVLALLALFLVAGLLWHAYRQQVRLAEERAKLTGRLEELVEEKTRELEGAQQALIAESNFAMLGKMSAAINHEINQPLASLRLNLATLRQLVENESDKSSSSSLKQKNNSNFDEDNIQSTVVDLDRTAKRITRVIETLRALPQQQKSGFVPVDMRKVLDEIVSTVKSDRKFLSAYLHSDVSALNLRASRVVGQRILLQQALLNILYNALDALTSVEEPYADITAAVAEGALLIQVRDNGPGVDPTMEEALFEPFESSPDKVSGMGIGLTLARQIITDHAGSLSYHRDETVSKFAPTGLTVFSIKLPLIDEPT